MLQVLRFELLKGQDSGSLELSPMYVKRHPCGKRQNFCPEPLSRYLHCVCKQ